MKEQLKAVSELLVTDRDALAESVVDRQFAAHPELAQRYGKTGRDKCRQDANYHLAYLGEALAAGDPALFADYIAWAKVMLAKRNIPATDLARHLELLREVLSERLPEQLRGLAADYLTAGLHRLPDMPSELPSFVTGDGPLAAPAGQYLAWLLAGQRHLANRLIQELLEKGTPVRDLYLQIFQPVQYEIGRLWQVNDISVAQEHYCTAATQLIMAQLYPHVFATEKRHGTLVATCVSGELHEMGVRMLADFFEMDGWHTFYLGANTPASSVIETIELRQAAVVGISATITYHVRAVAALIAALRHSPVGRHVKILVGGYPFKVAEKLWQTVGADGFARDAQEAIRVAHRLVDGGEPA